MIRIALSLATIVLVLMGCGQAQEPSTGSAAAQPPLAGKGGSLRFAQDSGKPEISAARISKDVVGWVVEVSQASGSGPSTKWTFEAAEYRRIDILERHETEAGIDLLVFMLTSNNPKPDEDPVQVSGQLRLHYDWKGRQWVLRKIDNVTFRYSIGQSI